MTVSTVNNLISHQESQLIQILHQQQARARTDTGPESRRAWMAGGGQNLPGADDRAGPDDPAPSAPQTPALPSAWEPADPALSLANINTLLLALQTQQASLDTTVMIDGSAAGPGGRNLIDYLTDPDTVAADATNDDDAEINAVGGHS